MVKRRHRLKQTTTLAHRLTQEVGRLRERAQQLPPGSEQSALLRKVRQTETALRIDAWLASPESIAPDDVMQLTVESPKKRPAKPTHGSAS